MRRHLLLLAVALALASPSVLAKNDCRKLFGQTVAACQKAVDHALLTPRARSLAHKLCVADAAEARSACEAGGNTCVADCEQQYGVVVQACTDMFPEGEARDACIANVAVPLLEACLATCI